MRKLSLLFLVIFSACALAEEGPSIRIQHISTGVAKGKLHLYTLVLRNQTDKPLWFILPVTTKRNLPAEPYFTNLNTKKEYSLAQPFSAQRYTGEGGSLVHIDYSGFDAFIAFRVAPNGWLEGAEYNVGGTRNSADPTEFSVFTAEGLLVNGKVPLDDWLPYRIVSDAKVRVTPGAQLPERLDWDEKRNAKRTDYRRESVDFVKAEGAERLDVKIEEADEAVKRRYER